MLMQAEAVPNKFDAFMEEGQTCHASVLGVQQLLQ